MEDFIRFMHKQITAHYKFRGEPSLTDVNDIVRQYEQEKHCILRILKGAKSVDNSETNVNSDPANLLLARGLHVIEKHTTHG